MKTLLFIAFANLYVLHPFRVSVCDVTYKSDDKHLKISVRMFIDDLEVALREHSGSSDLVIDKADSTFLNETLNSYFNDNLAFSVRNKPLAVEYLGSEFENDVLWSYLEVVNLKPFPSLEVKNSLLLNAFSDQDNLVHIRKDGVVRSLRLMKNQETGTVNWD